MHRPTKRLAGGLPSLRAQLNRKSRMRLSMSDSGTSKGGGRRAARRGDYRPQSR